MKELWIKSDPGVDFTHGFAKPGEAARPATLVGFWWALWLLANFVTRAASRLADDVITAGQPRFADWAGEASSLLIIAAAILAASVVWTIDRMQAEKSRALGLGLWSQPPHPPQTFGNPPTSA